MNVSLQLLQHHMYTDSLTVTLYDYSAQAYSTDVNGKGKGKVHPCTGTDALYRPYGP